MSNGRWNDWFDTLRAREAQRDAEIGEQAKAALRAREPAPALSSGSKRRWRTTPCSSWTAVTSSRPRPTSSGRVAPLCWLDPGVFGTLGVGGGFAVGASLVKPGKEVWLIYGDGSCAYSIAEMDTCIRHGLAPDRRHRNRRLLGADRARAGSDARH